MPIFGFKCEDCGKSKEHFLFANSENLPTCPACGSGRYTRKLSRVAVRVEYADNAEFIEKEVNPFADEMYAKIGKEAMDEDTKTLENLYGSENIENSIAKGDE